MSQIEFPHGYAGDVAASDGAVWAAWATCESDELSLFSEINRDWPLRPGLDADTWREHPPATMGVYAAKLSPTGEATAPQRLTASDSYIQGPLLASADGQEPWVVWGEQRNNGFALVAGRHGRQQTVATSPRPMLQPAAVADSAGRLCVAWQAWERTDTPAFALYAQWLDEDGTLISSPDEPAAEVISVPGGSSWSPALAATPEGSVWCAWEQWQGGTSHIVLRQATAPGQWDKPIAASTDPGLDLEPSLAVDPEGLLWVAWSRSTAWGDGMSVRSRSQSW
ncbi:MAG: hypothetical protein CL878_01055, partial [Dehalococcoidia bacterium]|nr:hypothetical protein [Dehalococcoidia bacterium]